MFNYYFTCIYKLCDINLCISKNFCVNGRSSYHAQAGPVS